MSAAPEGITTARLVLRKPTLADAEAIFGGFASDPEITRFMSWRTHRTIADTTAFLGSAIDAWATNGVGTYLVTRDGAVIGSTGLHPGEPFTAETGYIFRRDAWGNGYATEVCRAMVQLGLAIGLSRIHAACFVEHAASARVLEKSGMTFEGILRRFLVLPNLGERPQDMRMFATVR